jgi:acyl carrier protein
MQTDKEILDGINDVFQDILDDDEISLTAETTAKDVDGWDSLAHVRLMITIESKFHVKFSAAEIGRLKNVGDLISLIKSKQ